LPLVRELLEDVRDQKPPLKALATGKMRTLARAIDRLPFIPRLIDASFLKIRCLSSVATNNSHHYPAAVAM
jgi:hypothetical protein